MADIAENKVMTTKTMQPIMQKIKQEIQNTSGSGANVVYATEEDVEAMLNEVFPAETESTP